MDYVHALGAMTGGQAIQYVKAVAYPPCTSPAGRLPVTPTSAGQVYPDQSLYPANSVPSARGAPQQRPAPGRPDRVVTRTRA